MHLIDEGVVFASRPKSDAANACFPWVCVLETGRWLAGFRLAPAKSSRFSRAVLSWSEDQGRTWSTPREPFAPMKVGGRVGVWRAAAPTPLGGQRVLVVLAWEDYSEPFKPMFNEATEGLVDMKLFWAISEDGGCTFSKPRRLHVGRYDAVPTPITGPAVVLPDGRWVASFEVNKHYDEPEPWQHRSSLAFSANQGRSWGGVVDVHTDPQRRIFCWDQRLAPMHDGSLLDLFWTYDQQQASYLNIQARASSDGGKTWGELWDTGVPGQPARPVSLPDGRVVLVYVDRTQSPVIRAQLSRDGGRTFDPASTILVHERSVRPQTWQKGTMQDAWAEMSEYSIGLPDAVALPDGTVLTTFYSGDRADHTDLRWARISVS